MVVSKVKDAVKAHKCQSSGDFVTALSEKVDELVRAATARAKHNGRRTVRPYDL